MRETEPIFFRVMETLQSYGVLQEFILVGSWCQYFYQDYFGYSPRIPLVRTLDLDFMIPNPPRIREDINVGELLENLGFERRTDTLSGLSKFMHPDLEVEFLFPEQGRGKNTPYEIKKLHINAEGLRYLNLLQQHVLILNRTGIEIRVPEPAAFVLHKHIISERRTNVDKKAKDKAVALEIGDYLLDLPEQRRKLISVYRGLPESWKKTLLGILNTDHLAMHKFLKESQ